MPTAAQLEAHQENLKEFVTLREVALRLANNRDFKRLILDEYIVKEAARLVHMSADPIHTAQEQADALAMAQAAGHLKRFLRVTEMRGERAIQDIHDLDDTISEARLEEETAAAEASN
jgi:hypothetical protein